MTRADNIPVVAIDGPSGSGKGTLCQMLARDLGWHLLDSGALYRIVGLVAFKQKISFHDEAALAELASNLQVEFKPGLPGEPAAVFFNGGDISSDVRSEASGGYASNVAVYSEVRDALNQWQKSCARLPGLVADGRDMGTVVFPNTPAKIFLTASAEERAQRRYKQLINKGESVTLATLLKDIKARDERDMNRRVAPLVAAPDAMIIDSTSIPIDEVFERALSHIKVSLNI